MGISKAILACMMATVLAGPALAVLEVDNFDAAPSGGFNNPLFNHSVGVPPESPTWEFWGNHVSPPYSLALWPATDTVTLDLNPGEYADYAGVWMTSNNAPAEFEVIGTLDTYYASIPDGAWTWFDTASVDLGQIIQIRLLGYESSFDDLTINVVPEPSTLSLVVCTVLVGAGVVRRRKRKA